MKIGIASDHAGYELKSELIKSFLDIEFVDLGTDSAEKSVDYPDIAKNLCQKLIAGEFEQAILICGSGIGISIAANRFKEIRAALCVNVKMAELSRQHNNANILCLGARITEKQDAIAIAKTFFNTKFEGGRHQTRTDKLNFQC